MNNTTFQVGILVGSLRKASYNRKIAQALVELAPATLALEIVNIGDLPLYNEDIDTTTPPPAYTAFRQTMKPKQAVLLITPEYNRGVSAVIKNALDVGSRPFDQNVWDNKPTAVISSSIGAVGGFGANHQLRQSLVCLNMPCMQQPEAYLGHIAQSFDESGKPTDRTQQFLQHFINAYADWVQRVAQA